MIEVPAHFTRDFIQQHEEWTFVFSRCFWPHIYVGPSEVCKDIKHCYGVPVRWKLCKSSGYFQDSQSEIIRPAIDEMVGAIPRDKPVILFRKIGNGDSRMHIFAPRCYAYLHEQLDAIKTPVKYVYA